jgi:hypothetical protein
LQQAGGRRDDGGYVEEAREENTRLVVDVVGYFGKTGSAYDL